MALRQACLMFFPDLGKGYVGLGKKSTEVIIVPIRAQQPAAIAGDTNFCSSRCLLRPLVKSPPPTSMMYLDMSLSHT